MREIILRRKKACHDYRQKFADTFEVPLSKYYIDDFFGLDIVKFEEEVIKEPDDMSMEEYILQEYGEEAVNMVKQLL